MAGSGEPGARDGRSRARSTRRGSRRAAAPLWGAALLAVALGCGAGPEPSLVLISLDTVRRDHLPTYGYDRPTAPRLDALARDAVVFERAFAQDTNTNPSHTSMFTGLYPHVHGSRANGDVLDPGRVTLAQLLAEAGFRTGAFVSGVTLHRRACGLERGFEVYDDAFRGRRRDGAIATERARRWLAGLAPDERYFLFLHLYDAHGPYLPPARYAGLFRSDDPGPALPRIPPYQRVAGPDGAVPARLASYVDRYDALIRYQDDLVAGLLEDVDLGRTVVVVLSDHGETLGERHQALDHGGQVFDEQVRIPLIVRAPGLAPRRVGAPVETVDLLPTLLALLAVPLPDALPVQGRSLVRQLGGAPADGERYTFSSARAVSARHADRGYALDPARRIHSIRSRRWKLIRYPGLQRDPLELYDLAADPGERVNAAERLPELRDAWAARLDAWERSGAAPAPAPALAPELCRRLLELGYVEECP